MAKKVKYTPVRCIDCQKAVIHQWERNPLIAFCCGNPEKRNVAITPFVCLTFETRTSEYNVIHHQRNETVK